ncbi:hypothetical protein P167DRAFT_392125 [Morchella conica CCBAS932]|uniref:Uncharacterized protein n=1 Tax=Morchella conica CCBAS932 TaxID=1392247 RepID=A0A3N4KB40_9PEZI|nr:hypothetical protein P167DRAFT_392125 [Morchella conica CCBAS932]
MILGVCNNGPVQKRQYSSTYSLRVPALQSYLYRLSPDDSWHRCLYVILAPAYAQFACLLSVGIIPVSRLGEKHSS